MVEDFRCELSFREQAFNYGVEIDEDQVGAVDSSWCGLASSFVVDLYDAGRRFGSGISRRALIDMMLGERSGYAI